MVNLSYDPFQSQGATSGTANVAIGQSTGSQYQGADIASNLVFPESGQTQVIYSAIQFNSGVTFGSGATVFTPGAVSGVTFIGGVTATSGMPALAFSVGGIATSSGVSPVGFSGGGTANVTTIQSGTWAVNTIVAANSGTFAPAGYFFIQVPTSGNPVVKVPFFNS